jgi:hypothetical protein
MTPDSRRSNHKPLSARPLPASDDQTIRDLRTASRAESPVKSLLPWMGLILFCTGAVFQAGRIVERLDPQPQHKPAIITGLMGEPLESTAEKQQAEARARELEIQLATKNAELQEARLRAENELLRAELERVLSKSQEGEEPTTVAGATEEAPTDIPGAEPASEPTSLSPAPVLDPPALPEPQPSSSDSEAARSASEQPPTPQPEAPAESRPTTLLGGARTPGA